MLVKFFKGGTGKGSSPVKYLTKEVDSKGVTREPLPEIIKGNPQQTIQLIDSLSFNPQNNNSKSLLNHLKKQLSQD